MSEELHSVDKKDQDKWGRINFFLFLALVAFNLYDKIDGHFKHGYDNDSLRPRVEALEVTVRSVLPELRDTVALLRLKFEASIDSQFKQSAQVQQTTSDLLGEIKSLRNDLLAMTKKLLEVEAKASNAAVVADRALDQSVDKHK